MEFLVPFLTTTLIGAVYGTDIQTTVYQGSLNIPLLVSSGMSLDTIIPLIGAIIIVIIFGHMHFASHGSNEGSNRSHRSVEKIEEKMDGLFHTVIRSIDTHGIGD